MRKVETNQKGGGAKGMSVGKERRGPTVNRRYRPPEVLSGVQVVTWLCDFWSEANTYSPQRGHQQ